MRFRVEVICMQDDGAEQRRAVMEMERRQLAMETLGLNLAEGKAILRGVQDFVAPGRWPRIWSGVGSARVAASGTTAKELGRTR